MALTYNAQHTWWDYPRPLSALDYPESGLHDPDCKWLCKGAPPGEGLCRRKDHPKCTLCRSSAEKRIARWHARRDGVD